MPSNVEFSNLLAILFHLYKSHHILLAILVFFYFSRLCPPNRYVRSMQVISVTACSHLWSIWLSCEKNPASLTFRPAGKNSPCVFSRVSKWSHALKVRADAAYLGRGSFVNWSVYSHILTLGRSRGCQKCQPLYLHFLLPLLLMISVVAWWLLEKNKKPTVANGKR